MRPTTTSRCPRCDSPQPHLHPAVQFEGEVQPCSHDYHKQETPENTPERIDRTQRFIASLATVTALALLALPAAAQGKR